MWLRPHVPPCRWAPLGRQDLSPEPATCPLPCRGRTWARRASAPPLISGPERAFLICADRRLSSHAVSEYRCLTAAGRAGPPSPPGSFRRKEARVQLLFALHPLTTVPEIDRGWGQGLFFFFFPPISLLVQPQKVPYHCRMSGHTLPGGLATLDSPLIDFALPPWGSANRGCPLAAIIP